MDAQKVEGALSAEPIGNTEPKRPPHLCGGRRNVRVRLLSQMKRKSSAARLESWVLVMKMALVLSHTITAVVPDW